MKNAISAIRIFINISLTSFMLFGIHTFSAYSQQMLKMNTDTSKAMYPNTGDKKSQMNDDEEIAHPFFTHMGMPDPVGSYNLRFHLTATRMDGNTKADFGFHFETGLWRKNLCPRHVCRS